MRAIVLGAILAVLNTVWVTLVEVRYYMLDGSSLPLFITPIFLLFVLVGLNLVWRRLHPKSALRQEELLIAYLMAVVSNTFAGHDMLQNLFGQITAPFHYAEQNNWTDKFVRRLPPGLFVSDKAALEGWYRGNVPPDRAMAFLPHWVVPLALWGLFFLVLVYLFGCITVIFRRAWTENEKLAFPIIQLPVAMTEPSGTLFRQPQMWIGFSFAFAVGALNGIHELYPAVPNLPWIKLYDVGQYFSTQPWEAIRTHGMQTSLYPFAIGLAYFIPLDLAFSCWFSYLLARVYFVIGRASGLDGPSAAQGWPFLREISSGAWIGVAAAILWSNRKFIARAFDLAFDRTVRREIADDPEERAEAARQRGAWIGFALSSLFLLAWSYFLLRIEPFVAIGFFFILLALSLAITRVRAEFGTPHEIVFVKPADTLVTLFGTKALGDTNLIGMQSMYWFNRGYRCHPIPNFLEGFKMSEGREQRMGVRRLVGAFVLAAIISLAATYVSNYFVTYDAGARSKAEGYKWWVGEEAFGTLSSWISQGQRPASYNFWYFLGGLASVSLLAYLRLAYVSWPLHPAGFALGISYAMNYFWMCVLIAWGIKLFIVRYLGINAHKKAIPFFLGLILGDYTVGALWSLLGLLLGTPTYKIYI
ncbi:MAG: DUF6785 family protein [Capsulimonadales bacterium]|nr:DUF6785 family protein [Capsulimonadales bacterium]